MKLPQFEYSMMPSRGDFSSQWQIFKELYNSNYLNSRRKTTGKTVIPKIIHQIWLGSKLSDLYKEFSQTWKDFHPEWEYVLWTDEKAANEKMIHRGLYDRLENFGAKSDILRYEILNRYGGLYIDTDFICLKPFDDLHENLHFLTGIHDHFNFMLPNGLIACVEQHPVIQGILKKLDSVDIDNSEFENPDRLMETVGPGLFTDSLMRYLYTDNFNKMKTVVFPSTYFYPAPASVRNMGMNYMKEFIKPESYAIHVWEVSWIDNGKSYKKTLPYKMLKKIKQRLLPG